MYIFICNLYLCSIKVLSLSLSLSFVRGVLSGGVLSGGVLSGGVLSGGVCPGWFCPGGFVRRVLSGGVLSGGFCPGGFVQGGFVHGGFCPSEGFVQRGIVRGGFVLESRKKWNNASLHQIDSYKSVLNDKLSVIDMPNDCLNCENVLCNNNDHANLIQQMHDDLISACIDASDNIPSTRNKNNKLPGWN